MGDKRHLSYAAPSPENQNYSDKKQRSCFQLWELEKRMILLYSWDCFEDSRTTSYLDWWWLHDSMHLSKQNSILKWWVNFILALKMNMNVNKTSQWIWPCESHWWFSEKQSAGGRAWQPGWRGTAVWGSEKGRQKKDIQVVTGRKGKGKSWRM